MLKSRAAEKSVPIKKQLPAAVATDAAKTKSSIDRLRFISFGSGSSGNACYIGNLLQGIIIDAGVSPRALKKGMAGAGVSLHSVLGVFVTHDHIDHVCYAGAYAEKLGLPVFSTHEVHQGIEFHRLMKIKVGASKRSICKGEPFGIGPFEVTAFDVPHDGSDNVGYMVKYRHKTFVIATDLGHIGPNVAAYLTQANYLVLEANYEEAMLEGGPYPRSLKERIRHDEGHLSNHAAATFVSEHHHPNLSHLFLCHLSQENNHPDLALKTVSQALAVKGVRAGVDIEIHCLPRKKPSDCYLL